MARIRNLDRPSAAAGAAGASRPPVLVAAPPGAFNRRRLGPKPRQLGLSTLEYIVLAAVLVLGLVSALSLLRDDVSDGLDQVGTSTVAVAEGDIDRIGEQYDSSMGPGGRGAGGAQPNGHAAGSVRIGPGAPGNATGHAAGVASSGESAGGRGGAGPDAVAGGPAVEGREFALGTADGAGGAVVDSNTSALTANDPNDPGWKVNLAGVRGSKGHGDSMVDKPGKWIGAMATKDLGGDAVVSADFQLFGHGQGRAELLGYDELKGGAGIGWNPETGEALVGITGSVNAYAMKLEYGGATEFSIGDSDVEMAGDVDIYVGQVSAEVNVGFAREKNGDWFAGAWGEAELNSVKVEGSFEVSVSVMDAIEAAPITGSLFTGVTEFLGVHEQIEEELDDIRVGVDCTGSVQGPGVGVYGGAGAYKEGKKTGFKIGAGATAAVGGLGGECGMFVAT